MKKETPDSLYSHAIQATNWRVFIISKFILQVFHKIIFIDTVHHSIILKSSLLTRGVILEDNPA